MKEKILGKVFISSPSDLEHERETIKRIVDSYSDDEIALKGILWETDLPTASGTSPQELINDHLLKDADLLIGLFSVKFGSPTQNALSGTVEEIEIFINSKKPVILYFILDKEQKKPAELTEKELSDLIKIQQFKEKYRTQGIYKEINIQEIPIKLNEDLKYNVGILKNSTTYNRIMENRGNIDSPKNPKQLAKNSLPVITPKSRTSPKKKSSYSGNWWADDSITRFINDHLIEKGIGEKYRGDLTFYENWQMIKDTSEFTETTTTNILNQAKAFAFNKKYGNFDYSKDLRNSFPGWSSKIKAKIDELFNEKAPSILGVGSNYGQELLDIFGNNFEGTFSVLDISKDALERGKKMYPKINFIENDMESPYPVNKKFNICLCLRTIQSRGAFRQNVIIQMDKVLENGGLMLISIPNGYVNNNQNKNNIVRGLYDHRNRIVLERRPQILADKVLNKLQDYGYKNTGIETIDTEILIWGIKRD